MHVNCRTINLNTRDQLILSADSIAAAVAENNALKTVRLSC